MQDNSKDSLIKSRYSLKKKIKLETVYEDENIVAINKPTGILVYLPLGKRSEITLLDIISPKINFGDNSERSGIIHRLDKETSGVILVAKSIEAEKKFKELFKSRMIRKRYLAIVWGNLPYQEGIIDIPLGRDSKDRLRVVPKKKGKPAKSIYKKIYYDPEKNMSLLDIEIETGRTHQIRVHLSSIGHPVVGDKKYSNKKNIYDRHFLHASKVDYKDPFTNNQVTIFAETPKDFKKLLKGIDGV